MLAAMARCAVLLGLSAVPACDAARLGRQAQQHGLRRGLEEGAGPWSLEDAAPAGAAGPARLRLDGATEGMDDEGDGPLALAKQQQQLQTLERALSSGAEDDGQAGREASKVIRSKLLSTLHGAARKSGNVTQELKALVAGMRSSISQQHSASAGILANVMAAFSRCLTEKGKADVQLREGSTTMESKAAEHLTCRGQEKSAAIEKSECDDATAAQQQAKDATCAALESLKKDPNTAAEVCRSSGVAEDYESWLGRNRDHFIRAAEEFASAKEACANATRKLAEQAPKCAGFAGALDQRRTACNAVQAELESATCSYDVQRVAACAGYGTCWAGASATYNKTTPELAVEAESRRAQWRAAMRIECLLRSFDAADQEAAIDGCIAKVHDTSPLDLPIPGAPAKAACAAAVPLPCKGDFLNVRYGGCPAEAAPATCTPCMINGALSSQWVVVLKIGQDSTLGYSSPLWENDELLNEDSPIDQAGNAKYSTYLNSPFKSIRMCIGSPDSNCVEHTFDREWGSAKTLFSAGYIRDPTLDGEGILGAFAPKKGWYQDCPMQRPGFNVKCKDSNWARFGFCLNCQSQGCQNSDSNDADASIGIGLRGQSTSSEMGAGWTNYFASGPGTCSANSMTFKNAWLWVG
uniref:Uncharacterized protein n=1 Tax=Alexandrium monilatum TaxID=311494 RepID=A0A7S4S9K3_9DINO